jgi:putative nucleotidyltransferase with HDIG domain
LSSLLNIWRTLVTPLAIDENEAQSEYMARVILAITLIVVTLGSIPVIIGWGIINFDKETIAILIITDIIVISVWSLTQKGYWHYSCYLPPAILFFFALFGTYSQGMLTSFLVFYGVAIILVFMLHDIKAQWLMLAVTISAYLWVGWNYNPMKLNNAERLVISITVSLSFVVIALLTWFYTREFNRILSQKKRFASDLESTRDDLLKTNQALQTQNRVATALRTTETHSEMLPIILEQVAGIFNASSVAIGFQNSITGEILVELGYLDAAKMTDRVLKPNEGIMGYVLQRGKPYFTNNSDNNSPVVHHSDMDSQQAIAAIPLIAKQKSTGVLVVGRKQAYNDEDIQLILAIGDIAANEIQRATLHEETQLRFHRLNAFYNIEKAISMNQDIETALNLVLDQLMLQLGVHAADILLYESSMQTLTYVAGRGFRNGSLYHTMLRIGKGFAGKVALEKQIIYIPDITSKQNGSKITHQMINEEGFISYFGLPLILKGQVKGVLNLYYRKLVEKDPEWLSFLETLTRQTAIAIDKSAHFEKLQNSNLELSLAYDTTLEGWAKALELCDKETEGHSQNVSDLSVRIARTIGMKKEDLVNLRRGALLHDIGKMGIPDHILFKPGPLTTEEWDIIKQHPNYAYLLLSSISYLQSALEIPYCHHEWWDGSGYPRGLKGEEIPQGARIFTVVDVWDALLSDRPYRKAWNKEKALAYIQDLAGKQFDPKVVDVFLKIVNWHR